MENLDEKAGLDAHNAMVNVEAARSQGFRDGFIGGPAKSVSPFVDQQMAYFEEFRKGRTHREQVDAVCKAENIQVNDLMRKAFDFYFQAKYPEGV